VFLFFKGISGNLVGEWEIAEFREYINDQLDMATSILPHLRDESFEFMANGDLFYIYDGFREFVGRWESTGDGRIIIREGWDTIEWEYSLRGQELSITFVEEWLGDTYKTILNLRRAR